LKDSLRDIEGTLEEFEKLEHKMQIKNDELAEKEEEIRRLHEDFEKRSEESE